MQQADGARLPLEALQCGLCPLGVVDTETIGTDELDGRRPGEHAVHRAPDLAHAAGADLLADLVVGQYVA